MTTNENWRNYQKVREIHEEDERRRRRGRLLQRLKHPGFWIAVGGAACYLLGRSHGYKRGFDEGGGNDRKFFVEDQYGNTWYRQVKS